MAQVPFASLGLAWTIQSKEKFTEVQTLSFGLSMLMLGLKLCELKNLPGLWEANKALLAKLEAFKLGDRALETAEPADSKPEASNTLAASDPSPVDVRIEPDSDFERPLAVSPRISITRSKTSEDDFELKIIHGTSTEPRQIVFGD